MMVLIPVDEIAQPEATEEGIATEMSAFIRDVQVVRQRRDEAARRAPVVPEVPGWGRDRDGLGDALRAYAEAA